MKKTIILIIFILIAKLSFSLSIYPGNFEKDITNGNVEVFTIDNDTKDRKLYRLDALMDNENIERKIFPKIFYLNPGEKKEVKVFLKPNINLKDNIYNGNLIVQIIPTKLNTTHSIRLNVHMDIFAKINKNG